MNKKDLIQALGVGVVFGLVIYFFMMVAVHFIEKQVDYESVYPSIEFDFLQAVEAVETDLAMVTFKYEIRIQNSYDDEMLEQTETLDQAIDYILEYSKFHDDLYVYDIETRELMLDSATVNDTMRSLETKEQLLIEAAQHPKTFSDVEIFNLLVD